MRKREKLALSLSLFMALGAGVTRQAGAMHIMEGFLPPSHADYITKTNNEAGVAKAICHFTGIQI